MKKLMGLVVSLLIISLIGMCGERNLEIGDSLGDYLTENPPKYLAPGIKINNWHESQIDFLKYKVNTTDDDQKILVANNDYKIGVLQSNGNGSYFLYDLDGDGILDAQMDRLAASLLGC